MSAPGPLFLHSCCPRPCRAIRAGSVGPRRIMEGPVIEKNRLKDPLASGARIRVLDPHVANKIAAGEVVERPASVVKELVENALDAHAQHVEVYLEEGGRRLIRVVDDGWGMGAQDLERTFLAHATSKLADVEDLESIATLGFRGEALASIGSIAQARIVSREADSDSGHVVENRGGKLLPVRSAGAAPGTDVSVRNLFFNTPARQKFLRTVRTEFGHVEDLLRRFALAFPEVGFRLTHNGTETLHAPPASDRRERLGALFGKALGDAVLRVDLETGEGKVEAYLAPPSITRPNARDLRFFVNGRFVRDKILHRLVRDVYRDTLHGGRYPVVFLFFDLDPTRIDVNVHPQKTEIRWRDARFLHAAVGPALRRALRNADLATRSAHELDGAGPGATPHTEGIRSAMADFFHRAAQGDDRLGEPGASRFGGPSGSGSGSGSGADRGASDAETGAFDQNPSDGLRPLRIAQFHNSWLVVETESGLAIVDQHALHERMNYDRILKRLTEGGVDSQRLLVPEEVELSAQDQALLVDHQDLLRRCGIEWSPFGPGSIAVEALPAVLPRAKAAELVHDIAGLLRARGGDADIDPRVLFHDVADTMACKASVRFGDRLNDAEARALLEESGALDASFVCPHGRPTVWRIAGTELEKRFGRR